MEQRPNPTPDIAAVFDTAAENIMPILAHLHRDLPKHPTIFGNRNAPIAGFLLCTLRHADEHERNGIFRATCAGDTLDEQDLSKEEYCETMVGALLDFLSLIVYNLRQSDTQHPAEIQHGLDVVRAAYHRYATARTPNSAL